MTAKYNFVWNGTKILQIKIWLVVTWPFDLFTECPITCISCTGKNGKFYLLVNLGNHYLHWYISYESYPFRKKQNNTYIRYLYNMIFTFCRSNFFMCVSVDGNDLNYYIAATICSTSGVEAIPTSDGDDGASSDMTGMWGYDLFVFIYQLRLYPYIAKVQGSEWGDWLWNRFLPGKQIHFKC